MHYYFYLLIISTTPFSSYNLYKQIPNDQHRRHQFSLSLVVTWHLFPRVSKAMAPPNDPKQSESASGSGGGFFASIASSLSNFSTAMTRSVNGYPDPFLFFFFQVFDI